MKSIAPLLSYQSLAIILISLVVIGCKSDTFMYEERDEDGTLTARYEMRVQDSVKHGTYESFYEDGNVFERATYRNDTIVGKREMYYNDGNIQIVENYEKGIFEGPYISYYQDGTTQSEGQYKDNKMVGEWKVYYKSGQIHKELTFANNAENGPFKTYYENGNLMDEGNYKDGEFIHGEFKIYDTTGTHVRTMQYKNGRGKVVWTKEGVVFSEDMPFDQDSLSQ